MWTENPEIVVFLAVGLADCVTVSMSGWVVVSVAGCVSGVELILLTQSHLHVVDVFTQVSGNFAVNDTLKL